MKPDLLAVTLATYGGNQIIDFDLVGALAEDVGLQWERHKNLPIGVVSYGGRAAQIKGYSRRQVIARLKSLMFRDVTVEAGIDDYVILCEVAAAMCFVILGRDPGATYRFGSNMAHSARNTALLNEANRLAKEAKAKLD